MNLYKPNPLIIALLSVLFLVSGQTVFADSQKKFERLLHIDLFGDDITERGFKGISVPECENLCSSNNECVAYTYIVSKSWCFIKNGEGQPQHKPDVISGVLNKTTFSNPAKNMQKPKIAKDPSCKKEIQRRMEAIEAKDGFDNHVDILLVDINSDGRDEILYSEVCNGNGCYPDFYLNYFYETCQREFKWLKSWTNVFSLKQVMFDSDDQFSYITGINDRYDIGVTEPNKAYVTYKFDGKSVEYSSTRKADLLKSVLEITSTEVAHKGEGVITTKDFDLNGDGKLESISCWYWERWGVLTGCKIINQSGNISLLSKERSNVKRFGVLPEKYNGWHILVEDYDSKLVYEDGIGYVEQEEPYLQVFDEFFSLDIVGADLTQNGFRPVDEEECQKICLKNRDCNGYSFVISKNWCWPKSGINETVANQNISSGVLRRMNKNSLLNRTLIYEQDLENYYRQSWFAWLNNKVEGNINEVDNIVLIEGDGKSGGFKGNLSIGCMENNARWLFKDGYARVPNEVYRRLGQIFCNGPIKIGLNGS